MAEKQVHSCTELKKANDREECIIEIDGYYSEYAFYAENRETHENVMIGIWFCPFCGRRLRETPEPT